MTPTPRTDLPSPPVGEGSGVRGQTRQPSAAPPTARRRVLAVLACACLAAALAAGCETSAGAVRTRPPTVNDPCAERLHDLCGRILLLYSASGDLPETLEALARVGAGPLPPLVCPSSGQPYIYNREGVRIKGRAGRLVLYDPAPSHTGMRWAVFVETGEGSRPLTTRVVLLPEKSLTARE